MAANSNLALISRHPLHIHAINLVSLGKGLALGGEEMERLDTRSLVSLVPRPSFVFGDLALSIISELERRPAPVISYPNFRDEGAKHNSLERSEAGKRRGGKERREAKRLYTRV